MKWPHMYKKLHFQPPPHGLGIGLKYHFFARNSMLYPSVHKKSCMEFSPPQGEVKCGGVNFQKTTRGFSVQIWTFHAIPNKKIVLVPDPKTTTSTNGVGV